MASKVLPPNSSGIKVIVVGLGYAGVVAAVECHRKGHEVVVYEQTSKVSEGGDMVGITANAAHIVAKWGDGTVHNELQSLICVMDSLDIYNYKGEHLITQEMPGFSEGAGYMGKRNDLLSVMVKHAVSLGIKIIRGKRITQYFETDTDAGIIVDGEKITADCVLACDGVNSKARTFVIGTEGQAHPTGYATFRAWFDGTHLKNDPQASWLTEGDKDKSIAFIGPDVHCIFGTGKRCKEVVWVLTHLDSADIEESWTLPGKLSEALKVVENWDPRVAGVIKNTPESQLIDHKLLWRDPLPRWISDRGRVLLVGDSAHTFIPTSIQGAGQAMEDAATAAICLELAGKDKVPLALRTCQKMRYDRVTITQRAGIETRDIWHKTDWEEFKRNKHYIELPQPDWIFGHDPQGYAYMEFETAAKAVETGGEYHPRNIPQAGMNHRKNDFDISKKRLYVPPNPATLAEVL